MTEFYNTQEPIKPQTLQALEEVWCFGLTNDYREFLLTHNGGRPKEPCFNFKGEEDGSTIDKFFGIYKDYNSNLLLRLELLKDRIVDEAFPIARDVFGNVICLIVKGKRRGQIYFWDHETEADTDQGERPNYSNMTLIADSFSEFIDGLSEGKD